MPEIPPAQRQIAAVDPTAGRPLADAVPSAAAKIAGGPLEAVVGRVGFRIYTVEIAPPAGTARLTFRNGAAAFAHGKRALTLGHGATFSLRGMKAGADVLTVEFGDETREYAVSILAEPRVPAAGTGNPMLRPGRPAGRLQFVLPNFRDARRKKLLDVTASLGGVEAFSAAGLRVDAVRDPSGHARVIVDLDSVVPGSDHVTGDLVVSISCKGSPVGRFEPSISNVVHDEDVIPELPAGGGGTITTSDMGRNRPRDLTTGISVPTTVPIPEFAETPGDDTDPKDEPPTLYGEVLGGPHAMPPLFATCPAPAVVEEGESTTTEASFTAADPIYVHNGEFVRSEQDYHFAGGRGPAIQLIRQNRSRTNGESILGFGWTINWEKTLVSLSALGGSGYVYKNGLGRNDRYGAAGGAETAGLYSEVAVNAAGGDDIVHANGRRVAFGPIGQVARVMDRLGQGLTFEYDDRGRLEAVRDDGGRRIVLAYNTEGLLVRVEDWTGRQVLYRYYEDGEPGGSRHLLKAVTCTASVLPDYPAGATTVYTYRFDAPDPRRMHALVSVTQAVAVAELGIDPTRPFTNDDVSRLRGRAEVLNTYDELNRVVEQRYHGGTYLIEYDPGGTETVVTDRAVETGTTTRQKTIFRYAGNLPLEIEQLSALGRAVFTMEHGDAGHIESTAYVLPSGRRLEFTYDRAHPNVTRRGDLLAMAWVGFAPDERVKGTQELDAFGQVVRIVDPRGHAPGADPDRFATHIDYDASGNPTRITFPAASRYDATGQVLSGSPRETRVAAYDAYGQVTRVIDVDGVIKEYRYYAAGDPREGLLRSVRKIAADGRVLDLSFELDALGRPVRVTQTDGGVSSAEYDVYSRVVETRDPSGARRRYAYDAEGRIVRLMLQHLHPDDRGGYRLGFPAWFTEARVYDGFGRIQTVTRGSSDPGGTTTTVRFAYDEADRLAAVTSNGGTVTRYEYGPRSLSTRTVVAAGTPDECAHRVDYGLEGQVLGVTDPEGNTAVHEYDWLNRLVALHDPTPAGAPSAASTRFEYDPAGHAVRVRRLDAGGTTLRDIRRTFDERGRLAVEEDVLAGTRAVRTYDDAGRNTGTAVYAAAGPALLRETRRGFVAAGFGELRWVEDAEGNRTEYSHDAAMRLASVRRIGANGRLAIRTDYGYDRNGRLVRVMRSSDAGAARRTTEVAFDSRNLVVHSTDSNGETVRNSFNALGQLVAVDRFLDPTTTRHETYGYDGEGRLARITNARGATTTFEYDRRGCKVAATVSDGAATHRVHRTKYDRRGLPVSVVDGRGNVVTNEFDALGRIVRRDIQRAPGVGGATFERFRYDDMNQLVEAANDFSTFQQTFDSRGVIEGETQEHRITGQTVAGSVQRRFDLLGAATELRYPGGRVVDVTNDRLGRPTRIAEGAAALATLSYLAPRLPFRRTNGNGTRTTASYDPLGQIELLDHLGVDGRSQPSFVYGYDPLGNVVTESEKVAGRLDRFAYDPLHNLASAELGADPARGSPGRRIAYEYDEAGNRTRVSENGGLTVYTSNGLDQYTAVGPPGAQERYVWDADFHLAESPGRKLFHDYAGNLIRAEKGSRVYEFAYDPVRRLIHKRVTEPGQPDRETHYFYDEHRLLEAQGDEAASYVYGADLDEVISYRRGGTDYYLHHKRLWSVAYVTDPTGRIVESYRYDPFGARRAFDRDGNPMAGTAIGNIHGYAGRCVEEDLGLCYFRSRWYDPALGRFISPDREGWVDGLNVYRYARNNPITLFDPLGRSTAEFLSGLKDGFKDRFLGGWWDTLKTLADIVLNIGDYVETIKTMLTALTDPDVRANVWGAIKQAVQQEIADAWDTVEGAINALRSGATTYFAGLKLGEALGWLGSRLMRGGGSIAAFFANIGRKVKDLLRTNAGKPPTRQRVPGATTGCFLAATLVMTRAGPRKIEEILPGDQVLSRDDRSGEQGYRSVVRLFSGRTLTVLHLRIAGGASEQTLRATPGHPFQVDGRGWVHGRQLRPGDRLLTADGGAAIVAAIDIRDEEADHYNIEVDGWHTYFVMETEHHAPVWVHNVGCCDDEGSERERDPRQIESDWSDDDLDLLSMTDDQINALFPAPDGPTLRVVGTTGDQHRRNALKQLGLTRNPPGMELDHAGNDLNLIHGRSKANHAMKTAREWDEVRFAGSAHPGGYAQGVREGRFKPRRGGRRRGGRARGRGQAGDCL